MPLHIMLTVEIGFRHSCERRSRPGWEGAVARSGTHAQGTSGDLGGPAFRDELALKQNQYPLPTQRASSPEHRYQPLPRGQHACIPNRRSSISPIPNLAAFCSPAFALPHFCGVRRPMVFFGRAPAAPAPPPPRDGTLFACLAAAGLGAALLLVLRRRASASKKSSTAAHAAISVPPLRGWKSSPGISKALVPSRTNVRAGPWPVPLYKYSELFAPAGGLGSDGAPVPGVIVMHGWCFEEPFTKSTAGAVTSLIMTGKTGQLVSWDYTRGLCEALAKEGYAVLMIGLRDDDEEVLLADFPEMDEDKKALLKQSNGGIANCWPAKYYAKALNAAIDHLVYAAQKFHGVLVDEAKIGLLMMHQLRGEDRPRRTLNGRGGRPVRSGRRCVRGGSRDDNKRRTVNVDSTGLVRLSRWQTVWTASPASHHSTPRSDPSSRPWTTARSS